MRDHLEKRREALRQEISTLKEAITDIAAPSFKGPDRQDQLNRLRSAMSTRERELRDVEGQLAHAR